MSLCVSQKQPTGGAHSQCPLFELANKCPFYQRTNKPGSAASRCPWSLLFDTVSLSSNVIRNECLTSISFYHCLQAKASPRKCPLVDSVMNQYGSGSRSKCPLYPEIFGKCKLAKLLKVVITKRCCKLVLTE